MAWDWEFWLRLLAFVGVAVGGWRAYRRGVAAREWTPKGFFLTVALGLVYAAIGIGLMLVLAEVLGDGVTVAFVFFGYVIIGVVAVVWLATRIAARNRPDPDGGRTKP